MKSPLNPSAPAGKQNAGQDGQSAHPKSPKTLLVVDDEPDLREFMAEVLGTKGFRVLQAGDIDEAVRLAVAHSPIHLLITDFSLPDGTGVELAPRFQSIHRGVPVLLVTGSLYQLEGRLPAIEHFSMIEKPFQFHELLAAIESALARAGRHN